ncbi:MAG: carboxypeptidase regulatory-like domain-containing protein [Bryobacteraceae bacterium]
MPTKLSLSVLFLFAIGVTVAVTPAQAQTASLSGFVRDTSGANIPAVEITLRQTLQNITFTAVSDETGLYRFQVLPIGQYEIEAGKTGFKRMRQGGLALTVDQRASLDLVLEVGQVSESVEVTGSTVRVDTESVTLQQLVDAKRVTDLPLNGRNVYELAKLVPGTGKGGLNVNGGFTNGINGTTVNVRLDGGLNVSQYRQDVMDAPPPDGVQEFTIQTSLPSAKYAYSAGVIEVATKSGTNDLHGALYDFLRNDKLDARDFFAPARNKRRRNQFGGALGGPLVIPKLYNGRNRTFWFFNWEEQREPLTTTRNVVVLSPAQRRGDFTGRTIRDPNNGNQPFAGGLIPASRLDPVAQNVLKAFVPETDDAAGIYRFLGPADNNPRRILARGDQNWGSNQLMYRTYIFRSTTPRALGNLPYFADGTSSVNSQIHTVNYTRFISPRTINLFRFSYNAWDELRGNPHNEFSLDRLRSEFGFSNNFYSPTPYFPVMAVSGFFTVSDPNPVLIRESDTFTFEDDISLYRGKHSIEAGFRGMKRYQHDLSDVRRVGSYSYSGALSGYAPADFLLGRPISFEQQNDQFVDNRDNYIGGYIQDNIKLSPRITISLGLRYEIAFAPIEGNNRTSLFLPGSTQRSQRFRNAPPGLLFYGDPGVPAAGRQTDYKQFGPRVGIAWSLTRDRKTVLRTGYGSYFSPTQQNTEGQYSNKQPWVNRIQVQTPASTRDPWANFPGGNPFPSESGNADFVFQDATIFTYAGNYRERQMHQWRLGIEREFARDYLASIAYVGSKSTHLPQRWDGNAAVYGPGATVSNTNQRRPYYQPLTLVEVWGSSANSHYDSLQLSMDKRFSQGFSIVSSYTLSKSMDDTFGSGTDALAIDPRNFAIERGPSVFDRTHAFVSSVVWDLPFAARSGRALRNVAGGWQITGITSVYSGQPTVWAANQDRTLMGQPNRPNRIGDPRLDTGRPRGDLILAYFDRTALAFNGPGQVGTAPAKDGQVRAPGSAQLDLGVNKMFAFTERFRLQFRSEFFNLLNRPNFGAPVSNIDTNTFGRITTSGSARIIQFGLKFLF